MSKDIIKSISPVIEESQKIPVILNRNESGEKQWLEAITTMPPEESRIEALKLATDTAIRLNHFDHQYASTEALFEDMDLIYQIADSHLKYIMGQK